MNAFVSAAMNEMNSNIRRTLACNAALVAIIVLFLSPGHAYSSDALAERFSGSDNTSTTAVDHGIWGRLLQEYVSDRGDGLNVFRYGAVGDEDREQLERYLDELTSVAVTGLNRDEQFAHWINLYNALTIKVILDHYPVESIKDISFSILRSGPWKKKLVAINGIDLSLDDIEHEILRPIFQDSRIHYAVNCASIGCPNLQSVPFTASSLEDMLETAAEQYVNHPRGVSIVDDELLVSSIYDWYAGDFGSNERQIIEHLIEYADDQLADQLAAFDSIDDYRYDWSLNE